MFGYSGTYWDYVREIAKDTNIRSLVNLDISETEVMEILKEAEFQKYRLDGACAWIMKTLRMVREL